MQMMHMFGGCGGEIVFERPDREIKFDGACAPEAPSNAGNQPKVPLIAFGHPEQQEAALHRRRRASRAQAPSKVLGAASHAVALVRAR